MNNQNRDLEAFVGHLIDLYRIMTFKFTGAPHSYTKFRAIKSIQNLTKSKIFIETGTYLGVTTRRCAPYFEKVYTIELSKELAKKAAAYLKKYKHVQVLEGDATDVLLHILSQDDGQSCLVFLDGHFSGGMTVCGTLPEPAIEELKVLAIHKNRIDAIIIDDFRLFGKELGFPKKHQLLEFVETHFEEYKVSVHLDQVYILKSNLNAPINTENKSIPSLE